MNETYPCGTPKSKEDRRKMYLSGKMVEPLKLEGNSEVADLIENVFGNSGYNARRLAEACRLFERMVDDDSTICLTLAGAMTPIGMSGPIISLLEAGFVDMIIATGANIYHDLHRPFNCPVIQGESFVDDDELNSFGISRIYDTFIEDDETLIATDKIIQQVLESIYSEKQISSADLHYALGQAVSKKAKSPEKSFLARAAKLDVPVYTASPGDSSIGMNCVLPYLFGHKIMLDPILDIIETTAIVRTAKKNAAVIVGGGAPKNFYMQTQPTLWQILQDSKGGHDYFIQFTTDSPQWGGLSGATPQEAKSWGKVKEALKNNVVVYSCASITFPLLCAYALSKLKPKKQKQLYAKKEEFKKELFEAALKNESLIKEVKRATPKDRYDAIYKKYFGEK